MITDPQLMPDFRDGLEEALYRRASAAAAPSPARRSPRVLARPSLGGRIALGAAVLVAAIAVIFTSLPGKQAGRSALAEPLVLTSSTVQAVPPGIEAGDYVRSLLGRDVRFERSIALTLFGQRLYLLDAGAGWCILPYENASTGSFVCATTDTLERIGLAVTRGSTYVALIPPRAAAPTLVRASGQRSPVAVSSLGVAAITGLSSGDRIERHGVDGEVAVDTVP